MSLFDMFKEKASELLGGAGEKVSELTGVDLAGGAEQVSQAATDLTGTGQELADTATAAGEGVIGSATEAGQGIVDSAGPLGDAATGLAGDVIDPNFRG